MYLARALSPNKKGPVCIVGLSGENVTRLVAGEPMIIRPRLVEIDVEDVVVIYAKTEEQAEHLIMHHFPNGMDEKCGDCLE